MRSKPTAVTANEGVDIAGELIIFIFQLAISGRSHEGVDIAGERIIFIFQLAISGRSHEGVDIAGGQSGEST